MKSVFLFFLFFASSIYAQSYSLQITALNFLQGGLEGCTDVKDRIYIFSKDDKNQKTIICKNSKVELHIVSNDGILYFHAFDLELNSEIVTYYPGTETSYVLGKTEGSTKFSPKRDYSFTFMRVEDVSDVPVELLTKFNKLNSERSNLVAQVIDAENQGQSVPEETKFKILEL
ncbi:MAG: hypothetical protein QE271_03300 [Bacteriovoracaceae bacterium]|nr:hypothetical protein [Bacteriovoracaceae bacterium]